MEHFKNSDKCQQVRDVRKKIMHLFGQQTAVNIINIILEIFVSSCEKAQELKGFSSLVTGNIFCLLNLIIE